jgi:hypothetical protein
MTDDDKPNVIPFAAYGITRTNLRPPADLTKASLEVTA